jgi:hypothetical protein
MEDAENRKIEWKKILTRVVNELPLEEKLFHNNEEYNFRYVGYPHNRMGFLFIWESSSKRAIHISRVRVPDNFPMININDDNECLEQIPKELLVEEVD